VLFRLRCSGCAVQKERKNVSYKKGETRLSEILKHLGAIAEGGAPETGTRRQVDRQAAGYPAPQTAANPGDLVWPAGVESPGAHFAKGSPRLFSRRSDPQVRDAIAKVALYLQVQRDYYYPIGEPLSSDWRSKLEGFYSAPLLDRVRVVELKDRRVDNPWFYEEARAKGIQNLPDIAHKVAVTFLDVVVFNQKITQRDLFHGLVHAAQVNLLGKERFAELFVTGFLQARSYFLVPLKAHAFALDTRYAEDPDTQFSVEDEILRWDLQDRY
jgi:hypothetical protein